MHLAGSASTGAEAHVRRVDVPATAATADEEHVDLTRRAQLELADERRAGVEEAVVRDPEQLVRHTVDRDRVLRDEGGGGSDDARDRITGSRPFDAGGRCRCRQDSGHEQRRDRRRRNQETRRLSATTSSPR
jgi:hypothetical protein